MEKYIEMAQLGEASTPSLGAIVSGVSPVSRQHYLQFVNCVLRGHLLLSAYNVPRLCATGIAGRSQQVFDGGISLP